MSSNEPRTQQEKEPEARGASTPDCCQPCTPGRASAFGRMAERCAGRAEEERKASPCDSGTARAGGCCGEGSGK